jgi:hypothetical protein
MNRNDRCTARTKHIERRWLYHRFLRQQGVISLHHVNGDRCNLADIGTKCGAAEEDFKLSIMEVPVTDKSIEPKRGVGNIAPRDSSL